MNATVKKPAPKKPSARQRAAVQAAKPVERRKFAATTAVPATAAAKVSHGTPSEDATIRLVKKAARREGTKSAARYALYRDGMTVGAFLDAAAKAEPDRPRHRFLGVVRCDASRGNIRLEPAKR